jgi:hypothetical protein
MKKIILKTTVSSLFAAAIVAAPASVRAQAAVTNAPATVSDPTAVSTPAVVTEPPAPPVHKAKKHDHAEFNGTLAAVDTNAMTLTVGKHTFEINSETMITKAGKPATLADGVAGETVSGAYKKDADGKLTATSIHFGAKADGEKKKKKHSNPASSESATNIVPNGVPN